MEIWFEQITSAADERNGTLGVEPRARQLFFQFSPPPLLGFLYMASTYPRAARRGGVRFIRPACVFSVQTMLYTRRLYTCVYTCILRLYTCLVCRQFCIRRLEPSRKNFTAVKTVDVCCPPVFRFATAGTKRTTPIWSTCFLLIIIPGKPLHKHKHIHSLYINIYEQKSLQRITIHVRIVPGVCDPQKGQVQSGLLLLLLIILGIQGACNAQTIHTHKTKTHTKMQAHVHTL